MRILILLLLLSYSSLGYAVSQQCTLDLNGNGYNGEEGEIALCNAATDGSYLCPLGRAECDAESETLTEPSAPICPEGHDYNTDKKLCDLEVINTTGATPVCPADHTYDPRQAQCVLQTTVIQRPNHNCEPNFAFDKVSGQCVREVFHQVPSSPQCQKDFGFNVSSNQCEKIVIVTEGATPTCEAGFTYVAANNRCERWVTDNQPSTPSCAAGYSYSTSTQQCTKQVTDTTSPTPNCDLGSGFLFNSLRKLCEKQETITTTPTPSCSSGYTYDAYHNRCQRSVTETAAATATCSAGQLVNGNCVESIENCRTDGRAVRECRYETRTYGRNNYWKSKRARLSGFWDSNNVGASNNDEVIKDGFHYYKGEYKGSSRRTRGGTTSYYEICRCAINQTINLSSPIPSCPTGYSYNSSSSLCEKVAVVHQPAGQDCPSNYTLNSATSLCERQNTVTRQPTLTCESPHILNRDTQQCEHTRTVTQSPTYSCPSGYTLNGQSCEKTTLTTVAPQLICAQGKTLNPTTLMCESELTESTAPEYRCPADHVLNSTTKLCERTEIITAPPILSCPEDQTLNTDTRLCEKIVVTTIDPTYICPETYELDSATRQCRKTTIESVPAIDHECPVDYSYNAEMDQCERPRILRFCPTDSTLACTQESTSGKYYCSPSSCLDADSVASEDAIDGKMFVDNGNVDEEGMCTDQVMIFSGRASRCLEAGKSTAFKNCCKNTGEITQDTVGTNQATVATQAVKGIYEVASAAYTAYSATGSTAAASQAASSQMQALLNPVTLAWTVGLQIAFNYLLQACDQDSMDTSMGLASGLCYEVGAYCTSKWFGDCVQKARGHCCFNSKMARIIHEQGRPQLKGFSDWGDPKDPDCRGFSPEEFRALDFARIDLSEYYDDLVHKTQDDIQDTIERVTEEYFENTQ
jgi:conjugal transfer mating pair stabilization protein TraN